jgi:hypothetical protein
MSKKNQKRDEVALLRKVAELAEALRLAEKDVKFAAELLDEALEELEAARDAT